MDVEGEEEGRCHAEQVTCGVLRCAVPVDRTRWPWAKLRAREMKP